MTTNAPRSSPKNSIDNTRDKNVWNNAKVVRNYIAKNDLQLPEQAILNFLREKLPDMHMLDLGIGAGRTTLHFAPLVKTYLGSDYAEHMIEACRQRFRNAAIGNAGFAVIDAVHMTGITDRQFDFILFSFNGIDLIAPENRNKVFSEVRRVGKPGGWFAFSSHNLRYIPYMYALKRHKRWQDFIYQFYRSAMLLWYNGLPGRYTNQDYAIIRDGVEHFALNLYYSNPGHQLAQLYEHGFHHVKVFSVKTGLEIKPEAFDTLARDPWLYYLCQL